jgi:signal transduction histidine kinase/DNA-binding response OmpR family regulator
MLRKLKIGNRLVLGFAVILFFSLAISLIAITELDKIWSNTRNLYEHPFTAINIIKDIKISALNIRRYMLDLSLLKDQSDVEKIIPDIDDEETQIIQNFEKLDSLYEGEDIGIREAFDYYKEWKPLRDEILNKFKEGDFNQPSDLLITRNREYVNQLFVQLQDPIDLISRMADNLYQNARETKNDVMISLTVMLIATLVMSIVFAWLITRSITIPLVSIVKNIGEIAKGNLSNAKLSEETDEIGKLAASFNRMQDDLVQKAITARLISQGDFTARVRPGGDNDMVAESINMIANNFNQVVNQAERVASGDFKTEISGISKSNQLSIVLVRMLQSLREVVAKARKIAEGDLTGEIIPKSESDELAMAINRMTAALRTATDQNLKQSRLKTAMNELNEQMRGDLDPDVLAKNIITYISNFTGAQIGAIYIYSGEKKGFQLMGSYAFTFRKGTSTFFREGEGLVGQAALEKQVISFSELPDDYTRITSGLGESIPKNLLIAPFVYENKTMGVIELGSVTEFSQEAFEFLNMVLENIAISVMSSVNRMEMAKLLEVTKTQAEELQVQQEELRQTNEELEAQTSALKKSEENLQAQQEELRVINEELEDKTKKLEDHKDSIEKQNRNLEQAGFELEKKARELEISNRYKSEFLANMSHELRTPLNSLLLLSQSLMENKAGNLNEQQVQSASIIYNSGNDLLNLINDILDLSKIESGKMSIYPAEVSIRSIGASINDYFSHIAREKGLQFEVTIDKNVPETIITDEQKLNQILRNIVSNAVKFTEKGGVYVRAYKDSDDQGSISFSVRDTGIGIPADKHEEIFQAFQQVDGSISRRYSGSGLGLSITRELVKMLGGTITMSSQPEEGSEFTITIPLKIDENRAEPGQVRIQTDTERTEARIKEPEIKPPSRVYSISDDRDKISDNDPVMLIVEDDTRFTAQLQNICRDKGFKSLSATTGEEGIKLARQYRPSGIILDLKLPGMSGWDVLEQLKLTADTRHIPVHIISGYDETIEAFGKGAVGFLTKPVTREKIESAIDQLQSFMSGNIRNLLIIEDDINLRKSIRMLLDARDLKITECNTAGEAIKLISESHVDCIVLDLGLPDMSGFEMLRILKEKNIRVPPVVVYTGKELTPEENAELLQHTQNIIIKGVKSQERLLDETALFLHRVVKDLPEHQKKILNNLYDREEMFRGKKIMIVDDDMRNVFAITGVLESGHMNVVSAPDGRKALELLQKNPDVDLILMDIMMPYMDGYEAVKNIRKDPVLRHIPVIMLTAKAMKEDREKSLAAGANDYLSKPVDVEKLLNLMRIWLYQ